MSENVVAFRQKKRMAEPPSKGAEAFRWTAIIAYPGDNAVHIHTFDEFEELGEIMEKGPDWTGATIEIRHYEAETPKDRA